MPPITINIETKLKSNDKFLKKILSGLAGDVNEQVTNFIEEQAKEMASGADIYNVPESPNQKSDVEDASGYLADTIIAKQINETKYSAKSKVVAKAEHASWVEWGTGMFGELLAPHRIYPRTKPFMSWIGKDGKWRHAASTVGQYPKPFMRGAIYKLKAKFSNIIKVVKTYG